MSTIYLLAFLSAFCCVPLASGKREKLVVSHKVTALSQEAADTWSGITGDTDGCPVKRDGDGVTKLLHNKGGYCVATDACGEEQREGWKEKSGAEERRECFDVGSWGMVCANTHDRSDNDCVWKPVECAGEWDAGTKCSKECGGGTQSKSFAIKTNAAHGGKSCPASPKTQHCNTDACLVCNNGSRLVGGKCEPYAGECQDGVTLKTDSTRVRFNECESCNSGYYLVSGKCEAYAGTCENGHLNPTQAERTGHDECYHCDTYYGLAGTTCVIGKCDCYYGKKYNWKPDCKNVWNANCDQTSGTDCVNAKNDWGTKYCQWTAGQTTIRR